jgi:hypothetical protein
MRCYRGTQEDTWTRSVRGHSSWTPCLAVAVVYSARPGALGARFLPTSTVFSADLVFERPLELARDTTLRDIMSALRFGDSGGMTLREVRQTLMYLHKRHVGLAPGGQFSSIVLDEDGEAVEQEHVLFLGRTQSHIRDFWEELEGESTPDQLSMGGLFIADAFVFADAPAVQEAAIRAGYDAIVYDDVFGGAETALEALTGIKPEQVDCLSLEEDPFSYWKDWRDEHDESWYHQSARPLLPEVVTNVQPMPALEAVARLQRAAEA